MNVMVLVGILAMIVNLAVMIASAIAGTTVAMWVSGLWSIFWIVYAVSKYDRKAND